MSVKSLQGRRTENTLLVLSYTMYTTMSYISIVLGCRAALVNVEAQPISALSFLRKCVVAKVKDLTIDRFKEAVQQNAGGLLVVIPSNLSQLPDTEKEVHIFLITAELWCIRFLI